MEVNIKENNVWHGLSMNTIYNMDCIEWMKLIADNSIDCIITDPPYNIAKDNNFETMWRSWIDFWERDKWFDLYSRINELPRIMKKDCNIVIFNDWKNIWDIARYCERLWFNIKDMIRLEKTNPMPRNRDRRYITDYEVAIWLSRGKRTFNRQDEKYERPKFVCWIEKWLHPTQKNTKLMEWLVKIHSNEWQVVLDPFMWSWTTAIACINTNRNFIWFELDEGYRNIANKRIQDRLLEK